MIWSLKYGAPTTLDTLFRAQEVFGETPPGLAEYEPLPDHLNSVRRAFEVLNGARTYTEAGPQPIPISEVSNYLQTYMRVGPDELEHLTRVLTFCDRHYIAELAKKQAAS